MRMRSDACVGRTPMSHPHVPAKAGTQSPRRDFWIPACAGMSGKDGSDAADAVRADFDPRRDVEEPRRRGTDASVFRHQGFCHRLAPDECRPLRGGRRRARDHGVHQGRAARLRHGRRYWAVGRRVHPRAEALRRFHPDAQCGARDSAWAFRPQGAPLPALGGRRAAATLARDRRLGGLGARLVERTRRRPRPIRCRARSPAPKFQMSSSTGARRRGARMRPATRCSISTARMAT